MQPSVLYHLTSVFPQTSDSNSRRWNALCFDCCPSNFQRTHGFPKCKSLQRPVNSSFLCLFIVTHWFSSVLTTTEFQGELGDLRSQSWLLMEGWQSPAAWFPLGMMMRAASQFELLSLNLSQDIVIFLFLYIRYKDVIFCWLTEDRCSSLISLHVFADWLIEALFE